LYRALHHTHRAFIVSCLSCFISLYHCVVLYVLVSRALFHRIVFYIVHRALDPCIFVSSYPLYPCIVLHIFVSCGYHRVVFISPYRALCDCVLFCIISSCFISLYRALYHRVVLRMHPARRVIRRHAARVGWGCRAGWVQAGGGRGGDGGAAGAQLEARAGRGAPQAAGGHVSTETGPCEGAGRGAPQAAGGGLRLVLNSSSTPIDAYPRGLSFCCLHAFAEHC
jgi:hypothetical protein